PAFHPLKLPFFSLCPLSPPAPPIPQRSPDNGIILQYYTQFKKTPVKYIYSAVITEGLTFRKNDNFRRISHLFPKKN
ncbi:MAG: hypothetical protein LUG50_13180, partial [Planctomycetaceae bacterium]|nr:hypothetical protein [Planctomycetaceae bacterium]